MAKKPPIDSETKRLFRGKSTGGSAKIVFQVPFGAAFPLQSQVRNRSRLGYWMINRVIGWHPLSFLALPTLSRLHRSQQVAKGQRIPGGCEGTGQPVQVRMLHGVGRALPALLDLLAKQMR